MEKKNNALVIILFVIIVILCLTIGWLLGSKFANKENEIIDNSKPNTEEKEENKEEYTLLDKNSELAQFLYNSSRGFFIDAEGMYTTKYLKASDRSYENKLCLIMNQVKENTGGYGEAKIKELYEKVNGINSYNRLEKLDCHNTFTTFNFNANNNEYYVVSNGGGAVAGYNEVIKEVRKYDDKIEIITTYYFSGLGAPETWKVCTDRNCNTVLVESNSMLEIDVFEAYKDKLNKMTYTYNLAENGDYYYFSTEINK